MAFLRQEMQVLKKIIFNGDVIALPYDIHLEVAINLDQSSLIFVRPVVSEKLKRTYV